MCSDADGERFRWLNGRTVMRASSVTAGLVLARVQLDWIDISSLLVCVGCGVLGWWLERVER